MVVCGLKELPSTRLNRLPRMADFALWATACERAVWARGTFWAAYCGNLDDAVEGVIEANPVAAAVRTLMATRTEWTGTSKLLMGALDEVVGEAGRKAKSWPDSPRSLAGKLRRVATSLRKVGVEIEFGRGKAPKRDRIIRIVAKAERAGIQPSTSSSPFMVPAKANGNNTSGGNSARTVGCDADGVGSQATATVHSNPLKSNGMDDVAM